MNLLISVLLIILWSSTIFSQIANATDKLKSNTSTPVPSPAFTVYKNLTFVDKVSSREIENMPAIQSQDTVGSCFGCASATVVQKFLCDSDENFKRNGVSCSQLPREKTISQLSLVAWADTNKARANPNSKDKNQNPNDDQDPEDSDNHKNIKLYEDRTDFSFGSNALRDSVNMFDFMPESCFPFDQLVSKYGSTDSSLFKNVYGKTKKLYVKMKSETQGSTFHCDECLEQLKADFNTTKFSSEALSSAVEKDSFGEFLYELLFHNCTPLSSNKRPKFKQFPAGKKETADKKLVLGKIKEIIDQKKPVLISSLCLQYEDGRPGCKSAHDTVLSGYRKVCPSADYSSSECKTQVKLHNCWGQDWQNANNGGWVDADNLIKNLNEGKHYIESGDLSWLE